MRNRKPNRLAGYDYSLPGYYFITVNVRNREPAFGVVENGEMILNDWGEIVCICWNDIPIHIDNCKLDEYVIMPDHVHGIIVLNNSVGNRHNSVGNRHACSLRGESNPVTAQNLPVIIGSYKSAVSKMIHLEGNVDFKWQKSFHDRIIRDRKELDAIRKYIRGNTLRLTLLN